MTRSPFQPTVDDLNSLAVGTIAMTAALAAFHSSYGVGAVAGLALGSFLAILFREFGQRTIAQWMQAQVDLEISSEGVVTTLLGAAGSVMTGWPIILLFPLFNDHSLESYEHWGKSIDAMWIKRRYWIVSGGMLSMLGGWLILKAFGFDSGAEIVSMYAIFQLLPFDYSQIPTGQLDGSIVIRWSGFIWLIFMGLSILSLLAA